MALVDAGVIVIVEDDESLRFALERLLNAAGGRTAAFESAEAMLGATIDGATCVISDLKLTGMSGLQLLEKLTARGSAPPFILITAYDTPATQLEAMRHGASAYLKKPVAGVVLLAAIDQALQGRVSP